MEDLTNTVYEEAISNYYDNAFAYEAAVKTFGRDDVWAREIKKHLDACKRTAEQAGVDEPTLSFYYAHAKEAAHGRR